MDAEGFRLGGIGSAHVNDETDREERVAEFHRLVNEIEVAMLATRRADGDLVSRPMATQNWLAGADLWFVTSREASMLDEVRADPHVNVSYYRDGTREWVSVSGAAFLSEDRDTIRRLWRRDWRQWFPDHDGVEDGGPDDPRAVLIGIHAHSAVFMTAHSRPRVLLERAKGIVTGMPPHVGHVHELKPGELSGP